MKPYVLVIDDDTSVRQALIQVLESKGYDAHCASEGRQGLRAFHDRRPDLVIIDIIMPEMDGIETIREMRVLSRDCPIIAMSGGARFGRADFLKIAIQLGATASLSKPFEAEELLQTIVSCLAGTRPGLGHLPQAPEVAA